MKLIKNKPLLVTDINIVEICQQSFSFRLTSDILPKRFDKFLDDIGISVCNKSPRSTQPSIPPG